MKTEQDYRKDLVEIRSLIERSSRFLSLSGWAGIMAGIYALVGSYFAFVFLRFKPTEIRYSTDGLPHDDLLSMVILALSILVLSIGTAVFLSWKRAQKREERLWNATSRRLLETMAIPLVTGGIVILIFISKGLIGLMVPASLVFYGLSLYSAGHFTYRELKYLGITEVALGLAGTYYIGYSLIFWAVGFGVMHIIYGIYIYLKHER
jgi:hypothetical protein